MTEIEKLKKENERLKQHLRNAGNLANLLAIYVNAPVRQANIKPVIEALTKYDTEMLADASENWNM